MCLLISAPSATVGPAVAALLLWFSLFGLPRLIVTDMGSHFVNQVLKSLTLQLRIDHKIIESGLSWVNGSIERLNREVLAVARTLLSEFQISHTEWPALLPIVQYVLNSMPLPSLSDVSPIEAFTGLPPANPINRVVLSDCSIADQVVDPNAIHNLLLGLSTRLREMHLSITDQRARTLESNRRAQRATVPIRFAIGDFVLVADIKKKITYAKLLAHWIGPFQIIDAISPYVFQVRSLVNDSTRLVHASRLNFYADSQLDVTAELVDHVAKQGLRFDVDLILDHRFTSCYEVLVQWLGFSSNEATWEPLATLAIDVPAKIRAYLDTLSAETAMPIVASLGSSFERGDCSSIVNATTFSA